MVENKILFQNIWQVDSTTWPFTLLHGVIWLNIVKFRVYLRYRHCYNLFREMRKESEFRQRCCWNSTKVWERKRKSRREKIWISVMSWPKFLLPKPAARAQKWNQLWQCHCRNRGRKKNICGNCGNAIAENGRGGKLVVTEIWGGIKKKMLRPQYFYNIFTTNHRWLVIISLNLNLILRLLS